MRVGDAGMLSATRWYPGDGRPAAQDPEVHQQIPDAPDTLATLLRRISVLELRGDSALAAIADLERVLADAILRESEDRAGALVDLEEAMRSLLDSVGTAVAAGAAIDLRYGLQAADQSRDSLRARSEGVARSLETLSARVDARARTVDDSLALSTERVFDAQRLRESGDQRILRIASAMVGALLLVLGGVWWRGNRKVGEVRKTLDTHSALEGARKEQVQQHLKGFEKISAALTTLDSSPSHDLPIEVCNEINRIENNLRAMELSTRGHNKLMGSVRRVKESLQVSEYEMVELLGSSYVSGLIMECEFCDDETLAPGKKVIARVNRPEVRYRGEPIQDASVVVSVGPQP